MTNQPEPTNERLDDIEFDRTYVEHVGRRIAAMTPQQLKAYSERIAKKTALPTTPERVQMVLQAIPEVLKTIEQERQNTQQSEETQA